ncbi:transposase [Roseateles sp.]|uniref:transposase n=1 Tax=Roseateles sp. TaxID=1971397 RepID=UPI00286C0481|nr:transposase [Roseateles sp.]
MRIEFAGATYHLTSRGDRRELIFEVDADAVRFLSVVAQGLERYDASLLAYCLMRNHYHLVVTTRREASLSLLMRHINGIYTQAFNRHHGLVGHLFQGRFKAILVDTDSYLMELCRYVELNPVRAAMVASPADWPWSSYRAHVGLEQAPAWLDMNELHGYILGRAVRHASDHAKAAKAYAALVASAPDQRLWDDALKQQIYLGEQNFIDRVQLEIEGKLATHAEVPRAQRSKPLALNDWIARCGSKEEALRMAHERSGITMAALAAELGLTAGRVSQLIKKARTLATG